MVRTEFSLACLLALHAVTVYAVTADELRGMSDQKDRETVQRQGRANTGALGSLLPSDATQSSKYGSNSNTPAVKKTAKKTKAKTPNGSAAASAVESTSTNSSVYTPPARSSSGSEDQAIVSDAVPPTQTFGIRLGSWLNAELQRNTTSADSGTVELKLSSSYAGDRRTLPEGTVVFAEKTLNATTKRMEMVVTHGITPTGLEFEMRGLVFDPQKTPGLAGIFVLDKKQVAANSAAKGAMAAVGAAVSQLGGGAAGAATNAATQSVLSDTSQASDFNNGQQAVIYVSPQPLLIRVERLF
jgi:hypothetical protein